MAERELANNATVLLERHTMQKPKEKKGTRSGIANIKSGKDERNTSRNGCVIRDSAEALAMCLSPEYAGLSDEYPQYSLKQKGQKGGY
jgi:hypothetical protein